MITEEDYTFAERDDTERWTVHIKRGDYADVYYQYGRVQLADIDENGVAPTLRFQYDIIDCPDYLDKEDLESDEEFVNTLGQILEHILQDAFETGNYKIGSKDGESGDDYTEEFADE